ncbi:MAG: ABC transporter substrate-binding protein [Phycisphaerae bacterium]|nr:ABC transporter substrate-binding protein [Phycisphaerae bacterium]
MLFAVGAGDLLVGRSHECDFPSEATRAPVLTAQRTPHFQAPEATGDRITASASIDASVRASLAAGQSLYTVDEALLAELRPDLILTQDLCAVCSIDLRSVQRVAASLSPAPRVLSFNPTGVWQVLDDLLAVGEAVGRESDALRAVTALRDRWWTASDRVTPYVTGPCVLFLEWADPPFVGGHWTPHLIEAAGGRHPLNPAGAHSRVATADEIIASAPDRIVICPCGLDLARTRAAAREAAAQPWWSRTPAVQRGEPGAIMLVDGNQMFNRPGPRLVDAFEWLAAWIGERPECAPSGFPAEPFPPNR